MKATVLTLGCRVNQSESAVIEGSLKHNGLAIVDLDQNPDVCIINTCSVTAKSDYQSRQLIRKAARTGAKVFVTGCYSSLRADEMEKLPGTIELVDNSRKYEIVNRVLDRETELVFSDVSRSRPHLKVQDGCNFRCSYCTVPLARGRSRSVPLNEAIGRAQTIGAAGYNEIVLTGIHLGSYGQDLEERSSLKELIKIIIKLADIKRIRLSSLEVNEVDDELIELLQDRRLCSHVHIPLQSGSERILRLMRRHYTLSDYSSKIERILSNVENVALGSDIIVGFPGETDTEFQSTFDFLKAIPFSYLHIFPFSIRPDTEACTLPNRVKSITVKERVQRLSELSREKKNIYFKNQLHRFLDIIIEGKTADDSAIGTSGNYIKVSVPLEHAKKGSLLLVRITDACDNSLSGSVI